MRWPFFGTSSTPECLVGPYPSEPARSRFSNSVCSISQFCLSSIEGSRDDFTIALIVTLRELTTSRVMNQVSGTYSRTKGDRRPQHLQGGATEWGNFCKVRYPLVHQQTLRCLSRGLDQTSARPISLLSSKPTSVGRRPPSHSSRSPRETNSFRTGPKSSSRSRSKRSEYS
jgi:hypothetical protein